MIKLKDIIAEITLKESPDYITYNGVGYSWYESQSVAVTIMYEIDDSVCYFTSLDKQNTILTNYNPTKNKLKSKKISLPLKTHSVLKDKVSQLTNIVLDEYHKISHSRIFNMKDDIDIISFWEKREHLMPYRNEIETMLTECGFDPKLMLYDFSDNQNVFETYNQFILNEKKNHSSKISDEDIELLKQLHLNPNIKRMIIKTPSNRWQKIADKFSMTPIELKQLIGRELAEKVIVENMTYKQLMSYTDDGRKDRASTVNTRSIPVSVENDNEAWNFRYKSSDSTTGRPFQGQIQFLKDVTNKDAQTIPVKVDCGCPDFRYRFAYNNSQMNASEIGPDSLNKCINKKPDKAYDYGVGLCKHLIALQQYLKTKVTQSKKSNLFESLNDISEQGNFNINVS